MNSAHQELLEEMNVKMLETTKQASLAVGKAVAFVEASDNRIEAKAVQVKEHRSA